MVKTRPHVLLYWHGVSDVFHVERCRRIEKSINPYAPTRNQIFLRNEVRRNYTIAIIKEDREVDQKEGTGIDQGANYQEGTGVDHQLGQGSGHQVRLGANQADHPGDTVVNQCTASLQVHHIRIVEKTLPRTRS